MSLPDQETLYRAHPNNVWDRAAVIDTYLEGTLARLVPVGGKIACMQYTLERKQGGMHFVEAVRDSAHVDIDVDVLDGEKEIRGVVVPNTPVSQAMLDAGKIDLELSGEVVCDKLWNCARALGDLSDVKVFMPEPLLAS